MLAAALTLSACSNLSTHTTPTPTSTQRGAVPVTGPVAPDDRLIAYSASPRAINLAIASGIDDRVMSALRGPTVVTHGRAVVVGNASRAVMLSVARRSAAAIASADALTGEHIAGDLLVLSPRTQDDFDRLTPVDHHGGGESGLTVRVAGERPQVVLDLARPVGTPTGAKPLSAIPRLVGW